MARVTAQIERWNRLSKARHYLYEHGARIEENNRKTSEAMFKVLQGMTELRKTIENTVSTLQKVGDGRVPEAMLLAKASAVESERSTQASYEAMVAYEREWAELADMICASPSGRVSELMHLQDRAIPKGLQQ